MTQGGAWFLGGVVLGALVGGGTAVIVSAVRADAPSEDADRQLERLGESLERAITRALREARSQSVAERGGRATVPGTADTAAGAPASPTDATAAATPGPGAAVPRAVPRAGPARAAATSAAASEPVFSRDATVPLPAKRAERVERLVARSEADEQQRRRNWLFVSEEGLLRELGAPDEVEFDPQRGEEQWSYNVRYRGADGSEIDDNVQMNLRRGRVVAVWGASSY